ncbi:Serine/threonine-protein kinase NIM1 [Aphelenchoides bicaudatus]|nr:Serine/threonine-protein kinase NIM1 [Aphelenchoides bicaudatus]
MHVDAILHTPLNIASHWDSEEYRDNVLAGTRIALYELDKELGAGKFSKVKLGRHIISGDTVAVKIVEKSRVNEQRQHIFQRELRILELLHHSNIVRFYEYINTLNQIYVVTELAHGLTVQKWITQNGLLSEINALHIFSQLVAAVNHLHTMYIAHRDIKGDNMLFDPKTGRVKLIDFGFACYSAEGSKSKTFCGSLPYAAPELFSSKPYDAKPVDMWAMGVLLYFMLSGMLPFGGTTPYELKTNIKRSDYTIHRVFSDNAVKLLGGLLQHDVLRRMTIKRVMKSSLFLDTRFHPDTLHISTDFEDPDPRVQRLVHETHKTLIEEYNVSGEKLSEALRCGLHEPLTGLYRIKYVELCAKYFEPEIVASFF